MGVKFVAIRKNEHGKITHLMVDGGTVVTIEEAMELVDRGEVDSLTDLNLDGSWMVDSEFGHVEGSNLGKLPEF